MKKTFKFLSVIVGFLTITGCAQNLWNKPNAGQGEFERDRYVCLQQSQQRVGAAQVNAYGGSAVNTVATNETLFSTCMGSKGWSLQNKEVLQAQAAQTQARNEDWIRQFDLVEKRITAMCSKDAFNEYYKKTACKAPDISFEQIADSTKITDVQKRTLLQQQKEIAALEKEIDAVQKQRGEVGIKHISISTDFVRPENEKNNLDLYNGKITWGEYNKRRREINAEANNRFRK